MSEQVDYLKDSRDSWLISARHDRRHLVLSAAAAAGGLVLAGVGIETTLTQNIVYGSLELVVGGGLGFLFGNQAAEEVQFYVESSNLAAVKQHQITELENP